MGRAVKKVTSVIAPGSSRIQENIIDPMRGKVATPSGYNPDVAAFQQSARQQELQEQLRKEALGLETGPSQAQQQLQRSTDRARAQIAGQAASQRGNQALALRQAFRQQAAVGQEAAAQSAALRAEEMQAARDAYTQDLIRQQQSRQNLEGLRSGIAGATQQLQFQANLNKQQQTKDLLQQGANAALMMSDENTKTDIKKLNPKDLEEFATKLKASKFKYKKPNGELYQEGEITGIMAQDLEKSKIGKEMVVNSSNGKMVDLKKAVPATMAAVSDIMKRIKKLENKES